MGEWVGCRATVPATCHASGPIRRRDTVHVCSIVCARLGDGDFGSDTDCVCAFA